MSAGSWLQIHGPSGERRIGLDDVQVVEIGRGPENMLCLDGEKVSRRHALICRAASGFTVLDRGSRNGTQVNGRAAVGERTLRDGDRIRVGDHEIVFHAGPEDATESDLAPQISGAGATRLVVDRRLATVLVMDLQGYTGLSHGAEGKVIPTLVAELGKRASQILDAYAATFLKTIGDAVMAVWTHEETPDVGPALRSALEISRQVGRLGQEFRPGDALRAGAGIATGEVSQGGLGAQRRADVLGDAVNLAFRLEAATRQHEVDIFVCETSRQALGSAPETLFRRTETSLKGFPDPVAAFGTRYDELSDWFAQSSV